MHFENIIMRFVLFVTLCYIPISLSTAMELLSQEKNETNINLSLKNVPVTEALDALSKQTGYKFLYDESQLSSLSSISIQLKNSNLQEVFSQINKQVKLHFFKVDDTYTVVRSTEISTSKVQQGIKVTGTVSDNSGESLPGVSVVVRGTSVGTATDINGEYSITVPSDTSVLQFRFVGFQQQNIVVGNRRIIAVTLNDATTEIGEVVVVAFGAQKKESVIGSITTINPSELKIPSSNLTNSLAGNLAGVIAYQRSGEPGADNADFFVRGITTFGTNTNPLILIDGIELTTTDLARLQPDDIASFSVMKDATATALYGARGANGVILVTTKQGTFGPAKIFIRFENSISAPTRNVGLTDPVNYMKLANEAVLTRNPLGELPYSEEKIENTESGMDPLIYPANNWRDMLFKDYAMNQRVNLNVSGGGGVARYYVAGSFSKDNGILKVDGRNNFNNNINLKNYTLRANVNIDVTKTTELIVRLSGNFDDYNGPIYTGTQMYNMAVRANPVMFPAYYPVDEQHKFVNHILFGNHENEYRNPYAEMVKGYKDDSRSQMLAQMEVKQNLNFFTEGLSIRGMMNITRLANFWVARSYDPFWYQVGFYDRATGRYSLVQTNEDGTEYLNWGEGPKKVESSFYLETALNYNRTFAEKHGISGLLVFMTRERLNANAGNLQLSLPSRNMGLSGRATYAYDNRYFAEFNFGYNGSERFAEKHRFGFFPSAGLAWNVSNEAFWAPIKPVVSNLKLRYSYGLVGNDGIGSASDRFFYLSNVNMNTASRAASFGTNMNYTLNGISVTRYSNEDITWETSTKQNIALELGLWNKLTLIAEYFTEHRENILMDREAIPTTMGLSSTIRANVGEASGRGFDLTTEYQQSWTSDFWTSARANFTYATSKYEAYEEPEYNEYWRSRIGRSLHQVYGFVAERLFIDDEEARNSPVQGFGSEYGGGDIKYLDVNRDGKIANEDKVPIGYPTVPEIVYGFGVSVGYKGFDASVFFQGAARESFWINAAATSPFFEQTNMLQAYADSYWSENNRNVYATWPRLSNEINANNVPGAYRDANDNNQWKWNQGNTWFMRNGSFLRLKQAEIGYTIPGKWQQKIHLSNLRFYVSGTNLLLFSKFKLWDVEMAGNGLGYPIQRVINVGVNITFN